MRRTLPYPRGVSTDLPVHVLVVDDDPLVRSALRTILTATDRVSVVGDVASGEEALALAAQACGPRIDVVLMDLRMPGMSGVEATRRLRALPHAPEVVAVTTWDVDDAVLGCIEAGASGFLLKTASPEEITRAVLAVTAGDAVLSPRSTRQLLDHLARPAQEEAHRRARRLVDTLTERERDVVRLVASGLTNAEIASRLYLSEATVKTHLSTAQTRLKVRNRVGVAVLAERAGLLLDETGRAGRP